MQPSDTSESVDRASKKRRHASQTNVEEDGDSSDTEGLLRSGEPDANLVHEGIRAMQAKHMFDSNMTLYTYWNLPRF